MCSTSARGSYFEALAGKYLRGKGYRLVERNFRFGHNGETLVFVEVKGRASRDYGAPGESVTRGKMRNIAKAAEAYLWRRGLTNKTCRFDVVCVTLVDNRDAEFEHIRNAFEA